jgi:zinc transport system substrate-binding protein
MHRIWPIATLAVALALAPAAAAGAPRVVVTIKPLPSLVAGVMEGVGTPELLIRGAASPHTYSLRPSEARLLENAQIVFWISESLETFMERPLAALGSKARVVEVMRAPGVSLLPGRRGGAWGSRAAGEHDGSGHAGGDPHFWLDPDNARAIVHVAAEVLGEADPGNRGRYAANAVGLVARIGDLDAGLLARLSPVREVPFVVFHDAYQYFERRYALRAVGSIAVGPERAPGARRIREIREKIRGSGARCVFSEPQFSPAILGNLVEGTGVRTAALDPLGVDLPAGPDAWFALMRSLGASLAGCLGPR